MYYLIRGDIYYNEIVPAAVKKAREAGATYIFCFGWNYITFMDNIPTRQQLDAICSDIPIYFADDGLLNVNLRHQKIKNGLEKFPTRSW